MDAERRWKKPFAEMSRTILFTIFFARKSKKYLFDFNIIRIHMIKNRRFIYRSVLID